MTINVTFDSIEEMEAFARQIAKETGMKAQEPKAKSPVTEKPEEPKKVPVAEEAVAEEPKAEDLPFEKTYTMEDVRKKLLELQKAGKKQQVAELIASFGAKKFPEIPAEKYGELMKKAEEL